MNLPIIVYTGKELSEEEETRLKRVAETIIVKNVRSPERLLDESDPQLSGRKILIVDDDVRNIFTLSSVFEAHDSITLYAESGKQALEILENTPDIEIILMDIMMPDMDGYETMRHIRAIPS